MATLAVIRPVEDSLRPLLALGASFLTAVAGVVAVIDGDAAIAPFFIVTTLLGGVVAWGLTGAGGALGRLAPKIITGAWVVAAIWIASLLVLFQITCGCSRPPPGLEATYLGFTATVYHLVGTFGSTALIVVATFGRHADARRPDSPPPSPEGPADSD